MNAIKTLHIEQLDSKILFDKLQTIERAIKALKVQSDSIDTDIFLTRHEVAEILKISVVTVWSWTKKGILQSYRIGNHVRYKRSEIIKAPAPIKNVVERK
ncbi:helix-turn-helix domain-containing protein [Spirosoma panaciterrae]|uniref:helix-turn-helix domain-containing protein n=1 Tax=Spirosoma panaciterrae TaxID=496058 RepID=UPI00036D97FD|nr:helix-turn-helix domain-containing protein [Spirosoma panaciterrae]